MEESLESLYRKHAPSAFRRARRLLGSDADAHEVVHDLFLSLFERPEQYSGQSSLTTFMYSATTHACLNRIRNRKNRLRIVQEKLLQPDAQAPDISPDRAALLRDALTRMPEELAQVCIYHYLDELTHDDIARILGCSRRHVGNLLERAAAWAQSLEKKP